MPYIVKKLTTHEADVAGKKALVLDAQKTAELTQELELNGELGQGITYKEVLQLKERFGDIALFTKIAENNSDMKWLSTIKQAQNIEQFYDIVWERTILELMFMSQYYISTISEPRAFEQVLQGGTEFEFWFQNTVKYNMLDKIKEFYIKTVEAYANNVSMDIYESDVLIKAKEVMKEIEETHLEQLKKVLESTWNDTYEKYLEWEKKEKARRDSIIFD